MGLFQDIYDCRYDIISGFSLKSVIPASITGYQTVAKSLVWAIDLPKYGSDGEFGFRATR